MADTVIVQVDLPDVGVYEPNTEVGTVYEVAINGQGYMLAERPSAGEMAWEAGSIPLIPDRLATSETPFSEAVNRYTFYGAAEFVGGAGEKYGNRSETDPKKFYDGSAIDPFTYGNLSLGRAGIQERAIGWPIGRFGWIPGQLFVSSAGNRLDVYNSGADTWSQVTLTDPGAVSIQDITSDGTYVYVATSSGILRLTGPSNPGANWSTAGSRNCMYAAGRLVSTKNSGRTLITINTGTGLEEYDLITFSQGDITLGGVVGGYFYFIHSGGTNGAAATLYAWQLGLNESGQAYTPFEVWKFPDGAAHLNVQAAAGSVWVAASEQDGANVVLYRCVPTQGGAVTVIRTAETDQGDEAGTDYAPVVEHEGKVLVGWPDARVLGVGLEYGGYADWTGELTLAGKVVDIIGFEGELWASTSDGNVYRVEGLAGVGWISTPIYDGESTLDKVFADVTVACEPIGAGETIAVEYSIDQGASFQQLGTVSTPGTTRYTFPLGVTGQSIQLRATLTGTVSSPVLTYVGVRLHPAGLADEVLVLPIQLTDRLEGLNGQRLPVKPGWSATQRRFLQSLAGKQVTVQDIDWPWTNVAEVFEVQDVRVKSSWLQRQSRPEIQYVVTVTLRKPVTA